ncbi:MAG: DUF3817 domain-containing protein [Microscillaceae bacterium]|nr:DUF3817 domain-containing protein [Microscillaceae bacterium]
MDVSSPIGRLRILAFLEGLSFLALLFITMPMKYWLEWPGPNLVVGLLHGLLFVSYILAVVQVKIEENWTIGKTFWALLASVIPFGTFWADRHLFQKT